MAVLPLLTSFLAVLVPATVAVELVSGRSVLAYQTGAWSGMTADKAVDGLKDRTDQGVEYYKSVCAHPDTGDSNTPAQWSVDLGGTYGILTITVWNTYGGGGHHRMRSFMVGVNQIGQDDVICGSHGDTPVPAGGSEMFLCHGTVTGSGVFLRKLPEAPDSHLITICEVMVDGEQISTTPTTTLALPTTIPRNMNIAHNKPTNQSGTHQDDSRWKSDKAVDGQYDVEGADNSNESPDRLKYCARVDSPDGQPAEWWVDLGQLYTVNTVIVHNTYWDGAYYRMNYFTIDVVHPDTGVTECGSYNSGISIPQGGTYTVRCDIVGRYVRFRRSGGDRVTLCEVEVAGEIYQLSYDYTIEYVGVIKGNSTKVTIVWDQIPVNSGPSQDYGYLVVYWPERRGGIQKDVPYDGIVTRQSLHLSGLTPNTRYLVEIRPYRFQNGGKVYGTSYPQQSVTTPCGVPYPAANVRTITEASAGVTMERIKVTYQLSQVTGCNSIVAVWVEYRPQTGGVWLRVEGDTVGDPITVTVDAPGTYSLRLSMRNDGDLERGQDLPDVVVSAIPGTPAPTPTTNPTPTATNSKTPPTNPAPAPSNPTQPSDSSPSLTLVESTSVGSGFCDTRDCKCSNDSDIIIAVSVVVCVVVISLSVSLTTYLILRHRRKHSSNSTDKNEKHTYMNQQPGNLGPGMTRDLSASDPPGPDTGVYDEVNGAKQYEAITMETREPPPQDDAYQHLST